MSGRKYILKNRARISANLDIDINNKLIKYSKENNIPRTRVLDIALEKFFENVEKEGTV